MIFLRLTSSFIELLAAYLMFYFKSIETAIKINAILGLVGPVVLMLVTFIGLVGISHQLNIRNIIMIATGVILILFGTR
jgi:uncharacterized membrane protein